MRYTRENVAKGCMIFDAKVLKPIEFVSWIDTKTQQYGLITSILGQAAPAKAIKTFSKSLVMGHPEPYMIVINLPEVEVEHL